MDIFHKDVDKVHDPRLALQSNVLSTPSDAISSSGFLGKESKQSRLSGARGQHISKRKSANTRTDGKSNKHRAADNGERGASNDAVVGVDGHSSVSSRKAMKPLQTQNTTAAKKLTGPDVQVESTIQHSKGKGKEDLDAILRKRLAKLEASLSMIGSEQYASEADKFAEDIAEETKVKDGETTSANMHAERKKKTRSQDSAGCGKVAKMFRTSSDDDTARILAANIDGSMTDNSDTKFDTYISTFLKNETDFSEGFLPISANFSDEIASVIQSHVQEHPQNGEFGNLSTSDDQFIDTETIMLNVISQNLPDGSSVQPQVSSKGSDILPKVPDDNAAILQHQLKTVSNESESTLERHKEDSHLGCLSVDTQWDSQFVESFAVKSTHLNSVRDWRSKKLLDLLISGRLKEIPVGTSSVLPHEGTDRLVASSLQNILSNLSWLWSATVGDNMLDNVQDVVNSTASNLDSLVVDFVEQSGHVDIPVSLHLSSDQTADDVTDMEVAAKREVAEEDEDEEYLLLEDLMASLDNTRAEVLNQKQTIPDEDMYPEVPADMYSPTRPTEIELASPDEDIGAQQPRGALQTATRTHLEVQQSADVGGTLNDLVENSASTGRTVRIRKKENATEKSPGDRIKEAVGVPRGGKSGLKARGLPVSEEDLVNIDCQISDAGFDDGKRCESNLSVSDEQVMNQSLELSDITDVDIPSSVVPAEHTFDDKCEAHDSRSASNRKIDMLVESLYGVDSVTAPVVSHKAKSSRKHSSGKYQADTRKHHRSRKHKEHRTDATSRKNKKKVSSIDRQLKLSVRAELSHVQNILASLLSDKYGISVENTASASDDVSLRAVDRHFAVLSGISVDPSLALLTGENATDKIVKAASFTPLLNDVLNELNIPLTTIHLTLTENAPAVLSGRLTGEKFLPDMNQIGKPIMESLSPSSPPAMHRSSTAKRGSSVSRRHRNSDEAGVCVIPQRRQDVAVTEGERRLMKADKLMQTFRRSQIAKRQSQKTGPQVVTAASTSVVRQVQTVTTPPEGPNLPTPRTAEVESHTAEPVSLEVKEPDFSTVITDEGMLALVELPHVVLKSSLTTAEDEKPTTVVPIPNEAAISPVASSQTLLSADVPLSDIPLVSETAQVQSSPPQTTENGSDICKTPSSSVPLAAETPQVQAPSELTTTDCSAISKTPSFVDSRVKAQRIYVFNADKPLCREVEVCSRADELMY